MMPFPFQQYSLGGTTNQQIFCPTDVDFSPLMWISVRFCQKFKMTCNNYHCQSILKVSWR